MKKLNVNVEISNSLILRENFDYTEWQQELWKDKSIDEIIYAAKAYADNNKIPKR